ncbi:MAG TPA: HEAT repeat domain-containing protein [Gemmataceae bacterium]|nr:HEAT repeat domain-containing protein [Gemmataceae bacterium]
MRRAALALLATLPLACNKAAPPAGEPAPTKGAAVPVAAKDYDLKTLEKDLRTRTNDRRQAGITNAVAMDEEGEAVVPALLRLLDDPEAENVGTSTYTRPTSAREAAVLALLAVKKDKGKQALLESGLKTLESGLKDPKPTIREHTANAVGMIGPDAKPIADAVAKLCTDKDGHVRSAAYRALQKIKTFDPAPVLKVLVHSDLTIATEAAGALSWLKPSGPGVVPDLVAALNRPTKEKDKAEDVQFIRARAAEALGGVGKGAETAIDPLIESVVKADPEQVEKAIKNAKPGQKGTAVSGPMLALRKIGKPAVEKLRPLLKHETPVVRYQAAAILGGMGKAAADAVPDVQTALDVERNLPTGQNYVFEELIAAALNLGVEPGRVVNAITELLKHDEPVVRYRAAYLVARVGPKAVLAVPRLGEMLNDPEPKVQVAAIDALAAIGPAAKEVASDLGRKVEGNDAEAARAAAAALKAFGPAAAAAVPSLAKGLTSIDSSVSAEAAQALAAIGPEAAAAVPEIVTQLEHPDARSEEKRASLAALAAIGKPAKEAIPAIVKRAADKDTGVRIAAAEALGRVGAGSPEAVQALTARLTDNQQSVLFAALRSLGSMGAEASGAADAIKPLLARTTAAKVWAAAALCALGIEADANAKVVIDALRDTAPTARVNRAAAVEAMPLLGAKARPALGDLVAVLKERPAGPAPKGDQVTTRERAARSLGRLGMAESEVVRGLSDLLLDPAAGAKKAAAEALGELGPKALTAVPRLRDLTDDPAAGPAARAAVAKIEGDKPE